MKTAAGPMNKRIIIQRPVADNSLDGAGSGSWELVKEVWAEILDALPSRGEQLAQGINVASRPARVRIWFRDDVSSEMRFVIKRTGRVMQFVAGPAEIENGKRVEFMAEEYRPAGNAA